jgi:hypothetical protein
MDSSLRWNDILFTLHLVLDNVLLYYPRIPPFHVPYLCPILPESQVARFFGLVELHRLQERLFIVIPSLDDTVALILVPRHINKVVLNILFHPGNMLRYQRPVHVLRLIPCFLLTIITTLINLLTPS